LPLSGQTGTLDDAGLKLDRRLVIPQGRRRFVALPTWAMLSFGTAALRDEFTVSCFADTLEVELAASRSIDRACSQRGSRGRCCDPFDQDTIRSNNIASFRDDNTDHRQSVGRNKDLVVGATYFLADGRIRLLNK
jgi:hypothetical protein